MMIEVKAVLYRSKSSNDLKQEKINKANELAEDIASRISNDVAGLHCKDHPDKVSILKVIASPNKSGLVDVSKTGFCCSKFRRAVKV